MELVHESVSVRPPSASTSWGDWRLGDLSDAARRASDVLGASAPANWIGIYPPDSPEGLPWVQVEVEDKAAVDFLRAQLAEGEHLPHFQGDLFAAAFQAEVNDLCLHVWCR